MKVYIYLSCLALGVQAGVISPAVLGGEHLLGSHTLEGYGSLTDVYK
jgi:hypothetical protein